MTSALQVENIINCDNREIKRPPMKERPSSFVARTKEHDKLRSDDFITKIKINVENAVNTPGYAYRGMKGDPDFNFFEYLRVAKIPYYLGGIGLAAVCLAGRNINDADCVAGNRALLKKVLTGVLMYYVAREVANAVINIPVKLFRGVDLHLPYRKITPLREGNPLNLPNNKKPSNQFVYESTEFTRWDLLYKKGKNANLNETFDKLAKRFGVKHKQSDSDSKVMGGIRKLIVMATSWKYMLSVPFVTVGLGLAQQKAFENTDVRQLFKDAANMFRPAVDNRFGKFGNSFVKNVLSPVKNSFVELWKGNSIASKIIGRTAILSSVALAILANAMILSKTSMKDDVADLHGGKQQ